MRKYEFNRMEWAGSLGDLGTLLPLALGMIMVNGVSPEGVLASIGLYYILSGAYFGVTTPVQPMKVIGAYSIAMAMTPAQIYASGLWMGVILLFLGATGLMTVIGRYVPRSVIRGVQLSTGILLMANGVKFMIGMTTFQAMVKMAEPYLTFQQVAGIPIGILLGIGGCFLTFFFLENKRIPAGILVIVAGFLFGGLFGTHEGLKNLSLGIHLPEILPKGMVSQADLAFVLFALVLPQLPMTLGNAVIANADLSQQYFGPLSSRVTYRAVTISMGLANIMTFFLGGMPLCHGAGGLAAHYRFGARTAGSNLIIGCIFLLLAVFLGSQALVVLHLLPLSVLGVLLFFAGGQLALTVQDVRERKELFVVMVILGITLATSLTYGFISGCLVALLLKSEKMHI
jgi:sulfate permease, SulP family